jgi:hypothetical protein
MIGRNILPEAAGWQANPPIGQVMTVPAPTLGLNTREHFTNLQPNEARQLVNWLPDVGVCTIRPGYSLWCATGTGSPVKMLRRWQVGAIKKLLAASGGSIFEVLSGTASTLASGYTNDYWNTEFFNGYVFAVNGTDTPWKYNSSGGVQATGFSGPTLTQLRTVRSVYNRLWFTANNSADVYYGGIEYITGTLNLFGLSQIADGGICLGVFPWRANTVFCMSTGQVLVYSGDPSIGVGVDGFTLQAKYYAPALVEYDAAVEMGGELVLMTTSGAVSMDVVAAGLGFELDALGNWSKIAPSWQADYKTFNGNTGWFGKFFQGLVYFIIPGGGTLAPKIYVFNTRNQAWTTYSGLPVGSMEVLDSAIYIGSSADSDVYLHTGGLDDSASPIQASARQAFGYLGDPGHRKQVTMQKPDIFTSGAMTGIFVVDSDFADSPLTGQSYSIGTTGGSTPWGSAWDSPWSDSPVSVPQWLGAYADGRALAPANIVSASLNDVRWFSTDLLGIPMGIGI